MLILGGGAEQVGGEDVEAAQGGRARGRGDQCRGKVICICICIWCSAVLVPLRRREFGTVTVAESGGNFQTEHFSLNPTQQNRLK